MPGFSPVATTLVGADTPPAPIAGEITVSEQSAAVATTAFGLNIYEQSAQVAMTYPGAIVCEQSSYVAMIPVADVGLLEISEQSAYVALLPVFTRRRSSYVF